MTPSQIDRYKILELLGQGGMGKVYRAYDPHLNREVVLKLINLFDSSPSDEWRQRFQREVQAAGSLNHQHIVTVYDVALKQKQPYVVMELLTGGSLKERLKTKALPWPKALALLKPLAEALAYAHQAEVIHRDVKPENVMFAADEANTLKLVDFGLARWREGEGLTQTGAVMGTPAYMSPEQVRGEVVDRRTDIFALGIILFEAIAGRNPLRKNSIFSTIAEVTSNTQVDLSPLTDIVPPEVINLIEQAIAKDRDRRYQSCEALLADLNRCLGGQARPSILPSVSPRPAGRPSNGPDIQVAGNIDLTVEIEAVLQEMFSAFSQIAVEAEFGRGFSGSRAFQVLPVEANGKGHLPAVIKIAPIALIRKEWQAYQNWVEHTLPNIARLESNPIIPADSLWGGLRYDLVGGGAFEVQSLHDYYKQTSADDLCWVLENRLFQFMGPSWWLDNRAHRAFQMQADYDILLPVNLLIKPTSPGGDNEHLLQASSKLSLSSIAVGDRVQLKGFVIDKVDPKRRQVTLNLPPAPEGRLPVSLRLRLDDVPDITHYRVDNVIDSIHGQVIATRHNLLTDLAGQSLGPEIHLSAKRLTPSSELSLPNPLKTYQGLLQDFLTVKISTIHGDLNLENLLVDPITREISLIDFATVRQGHVLHDLLRLETEVVINLIPPILAEAKLPPESIYSFYEQLHHVTLNPGLVISTKLPDAALKKPFKILRVIRKMARKCLFNLDDWREYYRGLILYLLGAMKFKNLYELPTTPLPTQVSFWGAAAVQHLLEAPPSRPKQQPRKRPFSPLTSEEESTVEIEPPFGTMHPDSKLYIERAVDEHCWEQIGKSYAVTLFIQAPRQMGKSSLMRRIITQAGRMQQKRSVFVDFQKFPKKYFANEEDFLIEFCLMIGEALGIPEAIDRYWQGRRTNILKCSRYVSEHIVSQLNEPIILAMDEVERILTSPFQADFFGMLRTWHNDRVYDENLARLTLFLSSSTEPYLFIDNPNQSPFNVAEVFTLQDFTGSEVEELNRRHHSPLAQKQVSQLMELVGGHPFLTRLALYLVATGKTDPKTLFTQAPEDTGPFGDHLRHYLLRVLQKPELKQALARILRDHAHEENQIFYRLKGSGLIRKAGRQVVLRNRLYTRYFEERLDV